MTTATLPRAFIWRRLHSLTGLWFVLFLFEHLLTNSQAALFLGENGRGFVNSVNFIHNLPYLEVIEITLLGVPILVHMAWGVQYLMTGKFIRMHGDGESPALPYSRNQAYSWQRITSWILLFCLIGHVVKFRFLDYPNSAQVGSKMTYFVRLEMDEGLPSVADRLGVTLYDNESIAKQRSEHEEVWLEALEKRKVQDDQVIAACDNFGTASLLTVRNAFKSPFFIGIYTIFVLAACFHGLNGFWTFLITWGVVLKMSSQRWMVKLAMGLMAVVTFLGLASVWGTYLLNLKQ
jgi:succinate dehydrogenase / fumarate reductase, cytochrome b subunit